MTLSDGGVSSVPALAGEMVTVYGPSTAYRSTAVYGPSVSIASTEDPGNPNYKRVKSALP